ncbi:DUF1697 domain-containing protein [Latilactobacillus sakei]|uniref:DUF1697 domain-containing protein n=1 Tax=Latilactobacillus sakei TaxID=1599 RepID=UPI003F52ABA9
MQYIALLRGINVGGKRKVQMNLLRTAFEDAGFTNVRTYINSGNVLFETPETELAELVAVCDQLMVTTFGFSVRIAIVTADSLIAAVEQAPNWWGVAAGTSHNLIVAIAPKTAAELSEQLGPVKADYEQVAVTGQFVFWSAPVKTHGRTRWATIVKNKTLYQWITIRNANTARKLAALAQD